MTALAQASQQTIKPSFQRKNHDALHSVKAVFVPQSSIQASRHADSEAGDLIIDLSKVSPASSHPKNLGYGMSRILFLPRFSVTSFSLCPLTAECGQLPSPTCVYTGVPTGSQCCACSYRFSSSHACRSAGGRPCRYTALRSPPLLTTAGTQFGSRLPETA